MLTALTGTPGTGKSEVASWLMKEGYDVCRISELAQRSKALKRYDVQRESWEVDLGVLLEEIPSIRPLVLEGHLSHLLPVNQAVVLRCNPTVLRRRLSTRRWEESKISENLEAEALGVITQEAMGRTETFEIDATSSAVPVIGKAIVAILNRKGDRYRAGRIDWSEVILSWY